MMTFVELPAFSRARQNYLSDAEFAELQTYLLDAPDAGDVIPGSGGCRKLRWASVGGGKRGGYRVIYFLRLNNGEVILVTLYAKSVQENIKPELLKRIKAAYESQSK